MEESIKELLEYEAAQIKNIPVNFSFELAVNRIKQRFII